MLVLIDDDTTNFGRRVFRFERSDHGDQDEVFVPIQMGFNINVVLGKLVFRHEKNLAKKKATD